MLTGIQPALFLQSIIPWQGCGAGGPSDASRVQKAEKLQCELDMGLAPELNQKKNVTENPPGNDNY